VKKAEKAERIEQERHRKAMKTGTIVEDRVDLVVEARSIKTTSGNR